MLFENTFKRKERPKWGTDEYRRMVYDEEIKAEKRKKRKEEVKQFARIVAGSLVAIAIAEAVKNSI